MTSPTSLKADSHGGLPPYVVISTDCHAAGRPEHYTEYLEAEYQPAYRAEVEKAAAILSRQAAVVGDDDALFSREGRADFAGAAAVVGGLEGEWRSDVRRVALEADHTVAEVIFPNGSPFMGSDDPHLRLVGARAYNRWLAEFCSDLPGRRAGLAQVSVYDVDATLGEMRWAAENGLRGILLPPNPMGAPLYLDPCYEPMWAAAAEMSMPVHFHGTPQWEGYGDFGLASIAAMTSETAWFSHRPLTFLVWAGVLERHPDLRLVFTEIGAAWVPNAVAGLDAIYDFEMFDHLKQSLPSRPSEYWSRQCFAAASFMGPKEARLRHAIGLDNLMWGSDYPHLEGCWPRSLQSLRRTFAGVPDAEARKILGGNAAALYGFDRQVLQEVADIYGPTVDELGGTGDCSHLTPVTR